MNILLSLCLLCIAQQTIAENCSDISVISVGQYPSLEFTWTAGIPTLEFVIKYNCSDANLIMSWNTLDGSYLNNSTIKIGNTIHKFIDAVISVPDGVNTNITLKASEIVSSTLIIRAVKEKSEVARREINITITYCPTKELGGLSNTKKYRFNDSVEKQCQIIGCGLNGYSGKTNWRCDAFGNWDETQSCKKEEYKFNIYANSGNKQIDVPAGKKASFNCMELANYSVGVISNGLEIYNNTAIIQNVSHLHHGKRIFCTWTLESTKATDETSATNKKTGYSTLNVLSLPTFRTKTQGIMDKETSLQISFWSNPPTERSNIFISHNGNNTEDYYFRPGVISHDILFVYKNITEKNFGNYTLSVSGDDEFCFPHTETIHTQFDYIANPLHEGYIISIALGSVLFIILVIFIVLYTMYRTRWRSKSMNSDKTTNSTDKAYNETPDRVLNDYHPPNQQPSHQYYNQQPRHESQFDTDDDEFEPDDYEPIDSPTDKRAPMPVPPPSREFNPKKPPRSPFPSLPRSNERTLSSGLPPPRAVAPPVGNNRGIVPSRRPVATPPRPREVLPPPVARRPNTHGARSQTGRSTDYGQEYEETDMNFVQETYEVPVPNYR